MTQARSHKGWYTATFSKTGLLFWVALFYAMIGERELYSGAQMLDFSQVFPIYSLSNIPVVPSGVAWAIFASYLQ